jgi:hypothetical protein
VTPGHTPGTSTLPTSRSAGRRPVGWEIEELHRDVEALGFLVLEEGEAPGLPHDLHHQQRRQGAGGGAEPEERGGVPHVLERHLGGPPGLMKIFKLR